MANVATLNVYEINQMPLSTPKTLLFPETGLNAAPYLGPSTTGQLYGSITDRSTGNTFGVAENMAQLKALLNA